MTDILDKLPDEELTEEEHEALLLRSEHAIAPPLSPAARAVLDAANNSSAYGPEDCLNEARQIAAATLRAAADQVVPEKLESYGIRYELLRIADELEALPDD